MKKLIITAAALMIAVAAYGQGYFLFNTHDAANGNTVKFVDGSGNGLTGSDLFVQVLAGADATHLSPVAGATTGTAGLALNRTGAAAGLTSPLSDIFTLPASFTGTTATVGYEILKGGVAQASTLTLGTSPVTLATAPAPPNEVALGTKTVTLSGGTNVPEPGTLVLGALGAGALLLIRRRK